MDKKYFLFFCDLDSTFEAYKKSDEFGTEFQQFAKFVKFVQKFETELNCKVVIHFISGVDRQDLLAKPISYDEVVKNSNNIEDQKLEGNPYDLLKAMNKVLRRLQLSKPFETKITAKEISTEDRILQIKSRLINLPESFDFETLLDDCHSIHECIVTFLAVLVMAKDHFLIFTIDNDEKIWFKKGSEYE